MSGGGSNRAAEEANRVEQERQAAIRNTQSRINAVFDSSTRAAEIADAVSATRDFHLQDLDQQKATADRQLKFSLARGGLSGGSTNLDKQAALGRDYTKGLLQVDQRANALGANIAMADQDARARLISLATSGLDATTGASQASAAMRSAIEANQSSAQMQGLGDLFGQFSKFYEDSLTSKRNREADRRAFGIYGSLPGGAM